MFFFNLIKCKDQMILKVMVKMKLQGIEIWYTYNNIMVKVDFGYNRVILDRVIALGLGKFQLFAFCSLSLQKLIKLMTDIP